MARKPRPSDTPLFPEMAPATPPKAAPARQWTPQQWAAISAPPSSLLVSAAAGSGKTSVLAERCVHLICEPPRCHVNQLLVVTFTEAAAAEMKSRIERALRARLESDPGNAHLRRQFALIEHASCSTLHSFCNRLLRQHFHRLGLDPGFRLLDADEAMLLRNEIVRDLFMEAYNRDDADPFHRFIDAFGDGNDESLMSLVVDTHELLCSLIDPDDWMAQAERRIVDAAHAPLEDSELGREYLQTLRARLHDLDRDCSAAKDAINRMSGFAAYAGYLDHLSLTIERWANTLEERGYDGLVAIARDAHLPKLPSIPNSTPLKESASSIVAGVQEQFKKDSPLVASLKFSTQEWQDGLRSIQSHVHVLLDLVRQFGDRYRKEKDSARVLDFSDLERFTLRLLSDNPARLSPSPVARLLHKQFQYVLVDEYQDINEVQDAILTLASRECAALEGATPNLFCVGDVKQSIYRFRLAEPSRFLDRYKRFSKSTGLGRVIDLQANFRSRAPLLDVINQVFQRLMTRDAAEIEYDQSHRLHPGADYPAASDVPCFPGSPIELHYLPDKVNTTSHDDDALDADLERSEREALLVARRIQEMMGQRDRPRMHVMDRAPAGGLQPRPIEYRDIVILLRATRYHADEYADILRQHGIPVYNTGGGGYFDATEIRDLLSLLRLLDNQQQDIPLAAVLRSPLSGLPDPEDALARIRLAYPPTATPPAVALEPTAGSAVGSASADRLFFHSAVTRYAAENDDELAAKLRDFLATLARWRQLSRQRPIAELIWTIYEETGYLAFCNGLPNGQQRCANLIQLYERARQFGTFSRQGLYRFIRFLESLRAETDIAQASEISAAENVVRIMSVHSSKGLEFPVVFLPSLGKRINFQGCTGNIVSDRHAYLGLCAIDQRKRIRYPSLASMLVSDRLKRQTLAEELRVLYVAMTRAKEHLILVGTCKEGSADAWARTWDLHDGPLPTNTILSAKTMLDWLGPVAATLSRDAGQSIQIYDHPAEEIQDWLQSLQKTSDASPDLSPFARLEPLKEAPPEHPIAQQVIDRLTRTYPHRPFASLQASMPVTAWTHAHDPRERAPIAGPTDPPGSEHGEDPDPQSLSNLPEPRCLLADQPLSPADRGTAVHLFMEHLDFTRPCTADNLQAQLDALVSRKLMTPTQAAATDLAAIRWFLETPLGRQLRANPQSLHRELPLNYAIPPDRLIATPSDDPLDQVMIRGRIDLLLADERGFILFDYKTDDIPAHFIRHRVASYRPQVDLYREAIQRITSRKVHTTHLVFLTPRVIATA